MMIRLPLLEQRLRTRSAGGTVQVFDPVRRYWVALTPEEHVRQLLLAYLTGPMNYPASLIAVERGLAFGHTMLRFDIVVYHREGHQPWLLAECKRPDEPVNEGVLQQLLQYHSKMPACRYWLISNGHQTYCADAGDRGAIQWLEGLPPY
jgi:hypothetical protein